MKYNLCSYRHGTVSGVNPIDLPDDAVFLVTVVSGDVGLPGWVEDQSKGAPRSEKIITIYYLEPMVELPFEVSLPELPAEKPPKVRRKRKKSVKT